MDSLKKWKFTFGKYKGKTLEWVFDSDFPYLFWCYGNIKWFQIKLTISKDKWVRGIVLAMLREHKVYESNLDVWAYTGGRMPVYGRGLTSGRDIIGDSQ